MKKIQDFFTAEEFGAIRGAVEKAELLTSGEIRVVLRCAREKGLSMREQALADFYQYGLDKTKNKTGVLILVLFQDKKVEVLGDRGINEKVMAGYWDGVVKMIVNGFREGRRCDGICQAVTEVGKLLQEKFPRQADDVDELSNEVIRE